MKKKMIKKNSNQNFIVCCYDLQAMMQLPKGDVNIFYYKSKLNTLNFTVCDIGKMKLYVMSGMKVMEVKGVLKYAHVS